MDILIIGNGFDLAHGLKTSYKNFLEYFEDNENIISLMKYKNSFIKNIWLRHFITKNKVLGNNWIDLEQEIHNVIQNINEIIYEFSNREVNQIFPGEFSIQKNILKFDFNKITDYLKSSPNKYEVNNKKYKVIETDDFLDLHIYFENYCGFINFLYDELREFTKAFEKYLIDNILSKLPVQSKYQLSLQAVGVQPNDKEIQVLSFNYTDTCERLYKHKFNTYCNIKSIKPVYIHGKADKTSTCNLVFGTHNFDNISIPNDFNVFKKHNQRHKYGTIEEYQDLLKLIKTKDEIVFHIIGHSLDKTDHNILKNVLLANNNSVINIYYHNEESQERLINNITDIIGEEEVITKVRLIYQHDEKRGLLKYKQKTAEL